MLSTTKDDLVKAFSNQLLSARYGYDPVGLEGSSINATLLQGDYMAVHTFGWTEFEIAATSQSLTVTTYGIDAYTAAQLATTPRRRLRPVCLELSVGPRYPGRCDRAQSVYLPLYSANPSTGADCPRMGRAADGEVVLLVYRP